MKEKSKWYVMGALVIAVILLAPLAVTASGTGAAIESEEVMQISWVVKPASGEDTTWWLQELATKFNVEIIPNGVDPYDREKVAIMVSSGEFPDAGYVNQNPVKMYRDGVIRGIPKDMIREHMPDYSALLDSDYPFAWSHTLNPDNNDEVLVLHSIEDFSNTGLFYLGFRADWARKVGVDLPDYEQTKRSLDRFGRVYFYDRDVTLDWFEDLLVAFRDGDPDGNGKNDTIPFGPFQWLHWSFDPIAGAYGISFFNHYNHLVDGELYHWAISPAYKDFLLRMSAWYEMGTDRPGVPKSGTVEALRKSREWPHWHSGSKCKLSGNALCSESTAQQFHPRRRTWKWCGSCHRASPHRPKRAPGNRVITALFRIGTEK